MDKTLSADELDALFDEKRKNLNIKRTDLNFSMNNNEQVSKNVVGETLSAEGLDEIFAAKRHEIKQKDEEKNLKLQKENEGFFDKTTLQPLGRSGDRLSQIKKRIQEDSDNPLFAQKGFFGLPSSNSVLLYFAQDFIPEIEKYKGGKGTTPASIVGQGVAEPVALAFDVLGSTILTTVEKGLSYVGDETKQAFVNFFQEQMQTEIGQMAVNALSSGVEKWDEFSRLYPNDAANWTAVFELTGATPTKAFKTVTNNDLVFTPPQKNWHSDSLKLNWDTPDVDVSELKKLALGRTVDRPLAGKDKFLWNVAFNNPESTGGKGGRTLEQAETVTNPEGLLRRQKQLAIEEEIETVDILKEAGVQIDQTHQVRVNKVLAYMDHLEQKVIALAKKQGGYDKSKVAESIGKAFIENTKMIGTKTTANALKEAEDLISGFMKTLELDEFPDTLDGLVAARKKFDEMYPPGADNPYSSMSLARRSLRDGVVKYYEELVPEITPNQKKLNLLLKTNRSGTSVKELLLSKAGQEKDYWLGRSLWELGNRRVFMTSTGAITKIQDILLSAGMVPIGVVHQGLKEAMGKAKGLEGVAAIEYAKREMKKNLMEEIAKAAPKTRKEWLQDGGKAVVFGVIDQSAKALQQEYKEEQKNKEKEKLKSKLGKKSTDQEQEIITQPTQTRTFNNSGFIQPGMTDPSTLTNQSVSF